MRKIIGGALLGALLLFSPAQAMRLDNADYKELRIEDQRDAPWELKWLWSQGLGALEIKPFPIGKCLFNPKYVHKLKVKFLNKHKNYTVKLKCKGIT